MRPRSLAALLARRWVLYAAVLSFAIAGVALLLMFVLEDSFIDRRLRAAAIAESHAALPPGIRRMPLDEAPDEIRRRVERVRDGAIVEFRLANGRYVHVLRLRDRERVPQLVVFDATDELTVTDGAARAAPFLLGLLVVMLLAALLLAVGFVRGTARRASDLVALIRDGADPAALRDHAERERVLELAAFARLIADAWEQRLAALQRERDTLAFLAHELRTPLQSARTSLALLDDPARRDGATARLRRAVDRLTRAGNAVLWLASDADPERDATALRPLLDELAASIAPMAVGRGQTIAIDCDPALQWRAPRDVLETVAGNLLLNAIQHGGAGIIEVAATDMQLRIANPAADTTNAGFGIGLQIVARLSERCGWRLTHEADARQAIYRVDRGTAPAA